MSDKPIPERCPHNHGWKECLVCNYDADGVQRKPRFTVPELEAKVRELEQALRKVEEENIAQYALLRTVFLPWQIASALHAPDKAVKS